MSRYYFDLFDNDGELPDEEGQEVVSRPDLVREVAKIMMGLAQDDLPTTENSTMTTSVRDEKGAPVSVSTLAFIWNGVDLQQCRLVGRRLLLPCASGGTTLRQSTVVPGAVSPSPSRTNGATCLGCT